MIEHNNTQSQNSEQSQCYASYILPHNEVTTEK